MPAKKYNILFCLFLFISSTTWSQNYLYRHYTTQDGLCSHTIYGMLQDEQGFMWIGTDRGVNKFDGKKFERYTISDGLPDNEVLSFFQDRRKRIWFHTFSGRLGYYDGRQFYTEKNLPTLHIRNGSSTTIFVGQTSDDKIYFFQAGQKSLLTYSDAEGVNTDTKVITGDPGDMNQLISVYEFKGKFYYLTPGCILEYRPDKITPEKIYGVPQGMNTKVFHISSENTMNFVSGDEVAVFDGDRFLKYPIDGSAEAYKNHIVRIYRWRDDFWFVLTTGGCVHHKLVNGRLVYVQKHLEQSVIHNVYKDREGNVWFGTKNDGVFMLPYLYSYIKTSDQLKQKCFSVCDDHEGNTWIGSDNGNVYVLQKDHTLLNLHLPSSTLLNVKNIQEDSNHVMWIASEYYLYKVSLKGKQFLVDSIYNDVNHIKTYHLNLKDVHVNTDRTASFNVGSGIYEGAISGTRFTSRFESNLKERIYYSYKDRLGRYWISRETGLYLRDSGRLRLMTYDRKLLSERVSFISEPDTATMLVGTYGAGIYLLRNSKMIANLNRNNGLNGDICKKIVCFHDTLYALMNEGITVFTIESRKGFKILSRYSEQDDILPTPVNDMWISEKYIQVATDAGLVYIDRNRNLVSNEPPLVYIASVNTRGKSISTSVKDINSDDIPLHIEFRAISFLMNGSLQFRYRLQPWNDWTYTKNGFIEFSSLEGGDYRFEVSVRKDGGAWSKPDMYIFQVHSPIWKQMWFIILVVAVCIIGMLMYWIYSVRKSKKKYEEKLALNGKISLLENQALQALMHPHFVFNALNSIQHLLNDKDAMSANLHLSKFAKLIRLNLDSGMKGFITIDEEIERLKLYLNIEALRFNDKLSFTIRSEEDIDGENVYIPSMIVQPFVENALWHGILPTNDTGKVIIHFTTRPEGSLCIYVYDDGIGMKNNMALKKSSIHKSKGIHLIKNRLYILSEKYGKPFRIEQGGLNEGHSSRPGTRVTIILPMLYEVDLD